MKDDDWHDPQFTAWRAARHVAERDPGALVGLLRKQQKLIDAYEAGDMGGVEFFELALEADIPLSRIERILQKVASDD